jgi:heat shock protein HslJ
MEQESSYLALLGPVKTFTVEGDRLVLADGNGIVILLFAKTVPPVPEPFAGTNWTLKSFYPSDAVSSVISGTSITALFGEDGQVTGSAGCNSYFASYTLTGITLTIGQPGSTKKYCTTQEGVMPQENTYLTNLSQARTFAIQGNRMSLADANGMTRLSFTKSVPPV